MYNTELKSEIDTMFQELSANAKEITQTSKTTEIATETISEMAVSRIAAEIERYIDDIYTCLASKIKKEEYFKNVEHLNAFYRLNLREEINNKYRFEIESLDVYKKGIEFKKINQLFATAAATASILAVGSILKFAVLEWVHIPVFVIIGGAAVVGLAVYFTIPGKNKKKYNKAVKKFLHDMKNEIWDWLTEVDVYLKEQVRTLYKKK